MTMRAYIVLLLFGLLPTLLPAQESGEVDSLDQVLSTTTAPADRLRALLRFGERLLYQEQDATVRYLAEAIRIADERENTSAQLQAQLLLGRHYEHYQQYEYAIDELLKASRLAEGTKNARYLAEAKLLLGDVYGELGQSKAALNYLFEAEEVFARQQDSLGMARVQVFIGEVFQTLGDYDKAFSYYFEASRQIDESGDDDEKANLAIKTGSIYHVIGELEQATMYYANALNLLHEAERARSEADSTSLRRDFFNDMRMTRIADCYNRIAEINSKQGDLEQAFETFRKAVSFYEQIDDQRRKAVPFMNIGRLYQKQDDPQKALTFYEKALNVSQLSNDDNLIARSHHLIGTAHFDRESYDNALFHFNKSLDISLNVRSKPLSKQNYEYISKIYEYQSKPDQALQYYKYYKAFSDSLFNVRTNREIARLSIQHEIEARKRRIDLLEQKAKVSQLREEEARRRTLYIGTVMGLVLLILGAVFWGYRRRKQLIRRLSEKNEQLNDLNQQLSDHEDELMRSNSAKDKFFSIVAHDLKGPLNSLKGFTHMLSNFSADLSREEIQQTSERLHNAVSEVSKFLEGLLTWSRAQMNTLKMEPAVIEVEKLTQQTFALLKVQADEKNIQLVSEIDSDTCIYADENAISTVFRNLISNAIKFSYENGAVRIITEELDNQVLIHFVDSGTGMSEEAQSRLFRVDVRHTTSGTADEKGTGLGLIICKELTEKNEGTIQVKSQKGRGTTFTISLPRATREEAEQE